MPGGTRDDLVREDLAAARPSAISSSIGGVHGAGTRMRSNPPRRNSAACAHHSASDGSCSDECESSCSKFAASPSQPSSSHMFTTSGHRPVEPTVPHTP